MVIKPHYLEFDIGEHPLLPLDGHKFLRFSSKISSPLTLAAGPVIANVYQIAREHFGTRTEPWHEGEGLDGFYNWREVNDSINSYTPPEIDDECAAPSASSPQ